MERENSFESIQEINKINNNDTINHLKITEYDTVIGTNFEEIPLNKFLKKIEKNINKKEYSISLNEEDKTINCIFKGKKYILDLDNTIMKDFILNNNNYPLTRILKQLIDKQNGINKTEEERKKELEIFKNIEETGIISNDFERDLYLKYVIEGKHILKKIILKYILILAIPILLISNAFISGGIIIILEKESDLLALSLTSLLLGLFSVPFYIAYRFNYGNLKQLIKLLITTKYKIKKIKKSVKNKILNSNNIEDFNKVLDNPVEKDLDIFKDIIVQEINTLVIMVENNIKSKEGISILKELKELLNEYTNRHNDIVKNNNDTSLDINSDKSSTLKSEMIYKIMEIKTKIEEIERKEKDMNKVTYESVLLDKKIDSILLNMDEINQEIEKRENSYVKAKKPNNDINNKHIL